MAFPPILFIIAHLHKPVKARPGPILNPFYQPVFDRIEMNIIHMALKILFVPQGVLPKPALPDGGLTVFLAGFVPHSPRSNFSQVGAGKGAFDLFPASGIIHVTFGQGPDAVNMLGQ